MKFKFALKSKFIFLIAIIILAAGSYIFKDRIPAKKQNQKKEAINTRLSPELEKITNNSIVILPIKDSFELPQGHKFDSQIAEKSILVYPQDQKSIQYNGIESLESFKGIFVSSANTVESPEKFRSANETKLLAFKKTNPQSDAQGRFLTDNQGKEKYVVTQTKPYKMIETALQRDFIIEIVSYEETEAYKKIVDSYNASELINERDHKAIIKLHKDLVEAYAQQNPGRVFELLSPEAKNNISLDKISANMNYYSFKDMITLEPSALCIFDKNLILQSKVIFRDNLMSRLDISFKVDYDGEKNNWSIDSYVVKEQEKYLSTVDLK